MSDKVLAMGNGFWNVRGTLRAAGVVNVGTQCSLVRLESGKFIFLDSYTLEDDVRDEIMTITNDGQEVEAVLNVHPFHTLHCAQMAKDFPNATMYGSIRHHEQVPEVDWAKEFVESEAVTSRYPELEFSIPQGIYYIAPDDKVHAGSLLAYHPASKSLHVDDTFVTPPGKVLKAILPEVAISPMTKKALKDDPDAGKQYCDWAVAIAEKWGDTQNFCAAHSGVIEFKNREFEIALLEAVEKERADLESAS